ncbi:MAG TPA: NAD(P)-binding oxidoreductase [Kofleriaceae bacterium]
MKIVVFGGTGGTGTEVVKQALAADHDVLVMARTPEKVRLVDHLAVQKGDIMDAEDVASAIQGVDAVISTFGPADNKHPGTIMSDGVRNIIAGCVQHSVKRFVFESGLMCSSGEELGMVSRLGTKAFGWMYSALRDDKRIAEKAIADSALDWVIVRPPGLSHKPATGKYVTGVRRAVNATKLVPHADVAHFLLSCASDASVVRTIQNIGC